MSFLNPINIGRSLRFQWFKHTKGESHISECVANVDYDPINQVLTIEFQQRGTYKYYDFPFDKYRDFESSGSRGTYFNASIRNAGYNYERVA